MSDLRDYACLPEIEVLGNQIVDNKEVTACLSGVITENTIDYNRLFTLIEPPFGSEPSLCLCRRRRHTEESRQSDDQGNQAPTIQAILVREAQ